MRRRRRKASVRSLYGACRRPRNVGTGAVIFIGSDCAARRSSAAPVPSIPVLPAVVDRRVGSAEPLDSSTESPTGSPPRSSEPDYARLSVQVQNGMRQQLRLYREIVARMGALQAISFVGVGAAGEDIYQVRAENSSAEVRIDLLKDGRIASVVLGPE